MFVMIKNKWVYKYVCTWINDKWNENNECFFLYLNRVKWNSVQNVKKMLKKIDKDSWVDIHIFFSCG
jgi:hypothetical protein